MQKAIAMPWQGDTLASFPEVETVAVGKIERAIEMSDVPRSSALACRGLSLFV